MMHIDSWQGVVSLIIDGGMVIAMVGLWLLWLQAFRRQRAVELKLDAASAQLQEASAQLNALMPLLADITDPRSSPPPVSREVVEPRQTIKGPVEDESIANADAGHARLSRLLCLNREGLNVQQIARQLDMPLAQVTLLLQVHSKSVESRS